MQKARMDKMPVAIESPGDPVFALGENVSGLDLDDYEGDEVIASHPYAVGVDVLFYMRNNHDCFQQSPDFSG